MNAETQRHNPRFSLIVPVYNRVGEVTELLESLKNQTVKNFEVVIVEDGSTDPCSDVCESYRNQGVDISYWYKENEGRSIARNYGMERAKGEWFIFFDSDCVAPPDYFEKAEKLLEGDHIDCYGGPDAAHDSFTDTQKAINFAMTSFLTTGGIRGGKIRLEKFVPRTFNMGFKRDVYKTVGGFREMFSEDIDMSTRIRQAGFKIDLLLNLPVYHKRRVDLRKFWRQVYVFGMSRITLKQLYPGSLKAVHTLPAIAVIMAVILILLSLLCSPLWLLPIAAWFMAIFVSALLTTHSLKVALLSIPASAIQIGGYGCGFIKAYFTNILLGRGRDLDKEIEIRKGKNEKH